MNAAGIDVSKGKSMVAVSRPLGEVVTKPFEVAHKSRDVRELIRFLQNIDGDTRVIMEHTGRYHEPMAQALSDAGLFVCTVNPKLIKDYGNNSLRRVKTDKADALKIARYGLDNWHELRQYTPMDKTRAQLKTMNRQFDFYMKQKTASKNNLVALIDQAYPGANDFFNSPARCDGSQKWVDFVSSFWHVDCVRSIGLSAFTTRYQKWCQRHGYHFQAHKPAEIFEASRDLLPMLPKDDMSKLLITRAIDQLNSISKTIETLRSEMNLLAEKLPEYPVVMAMRGVGPSLGPQLMAEIGDVTRFAKRESLTAFAGVDPGVDQSGGHESQSVPTTKHGSPHLRKTLFQVMDVLIKTSPPDDAVYCFMDKKRSEGKPYYVYMTAGANKFLRVYYGRVKQYLASLSETE